MRALYFLAALGAVAPTVAAQQKPDSLVTLERIFNSDDFDEDGAGAFRWLADGTAYTVFAAPADSQPGRDLVKVDAKTGEKTVLYHAAQFKPEGAEHPLGLRGYTLSADLNKMLIFTNTQRVWRANTRGDYWVLDRVSGKLKQLGGNAKPSTVMFAKFSPDG
ncbi:MAG TPA: DPP IV N-terminal domain-containing protein, partial [Gemmatimonadales bacterium]|nr:DPP IV N-terminal domain-containing protein [Gemmatimonadales bacterium]